MPVPNTVHFYGDISPHVFGELLTRVLLFITFFFTENMNPFIRVIQPEEYWLYRFPSEASIVTANWLYVSYAVSKVFNPVVIIITGFAVIGVFYGINRQLREACCAFYVITLALPLTGIITNIIKVTVGRPRPDFFNRCYGENYLNYLDLKKPCSGNTGTVLDGRKSFPSGHSSMSCCVFGFVFLYTAGQLGTFAKRNASGSWKLLICTVPLMMATLIAISRTCDYHHHWQDITVGSILGYTVVYVAYRQYFHGLTDSDCRKSYSVRSTYINANLEEISASQSEGQGHHGSIRSILRAHPVQSANSKHLVKTV